MDDEFDHFFVAPSDFERTLAFYAGTLGWSVTSSWGGQAGHHRQARGALLQNGKMQVAIAERHFDDINDQSNKAINATRPTIYIAVDELDARFNALPDKSVVVIEPETTHWGAGWFVVRDPDGNLIAFTQRS